MELLLNDSETDEISWLNYARQNELSFETILKAIRRQ